MSSSSLQHQASNTQPSLRKLQHQMKSILLLTLFAALCALVAADCSVSVTQTLGSAWKQDGKDMSQWNVVLTAGSEAVRSVQLSITGAKIDQLWELELQSNGLYALPAWRVQNGGIPAGLTHQFGYIWESASKATIAVSAVNCAAPSAAPSTVPSPAPASPSASPAPASPSPSALPTVVASPQPSPVGCSVSASVVARSADAGGVWQDGGKTFQIFDVTFTNNGQRPVNGAIISFALGGSSPSISQYWELSRRGATSNDFNVSFNYGPLQVGASQGAGIIVSVAGTSPAPLPGYTVSSLSCQ